VLAPVSNLHITNFSYSLAICRGKEKYQKKTIKAALGAAYSIVSRMKMRCVPAIDNCRCRGVTSERLVKEMRVGQRYIMNRKISIFTVAVLVACIVCYSFGYHAGVKQAFLQKTFQAKSQSTIFNQADLLALEAVQVNSLHPDTHTLVIGGLLAPKGQ
jgi:hypothetical protein